MVGSFQPVLFLLLLSLFGSFGRTWMKPKFNNRQSDPLSIWFQVYFILKYNDHRNQAQLPEDSSLLLPPLPQHIPNTHILAFWFYGSFTNSNVNARTGFCFVNQKGFNICDGTSRHQASSPLQVEIWAIWDASNLEAQPNFTANSDSLEAVLICNRCKLIPPC